MMYTERNMAELGEAVCLKHFCTCVCVCVCVCLVIVSSSYEHGQLMYCDSLFLLMVTFIYWSLLVKFKLVLVGKDECVLV